MQTEQQYYKNKIKQLEKELAIANSSADMYKPEGVAMQTLRAGIRDISDFPKVEKDGFNMTLFRYICDMRNKIDKLEEQIKSYQEDKR